MAARGDRERAAASHDMHGFYVSGGVHLFFHLRVGIAGETERPRSSLAFVIFEVHG